MSELMHEIEQELQREKLLKAWQKYGGYIVVAAVAIVLATAGSMVWKDWKHTRNIEATQALTAVLDQSKAETDALVAASVLENYASEATDGHKMLAQFYQAAALTRAGKNKEAANVYEVLSQSRGLPAYYTDLATFLYVMRRVGEADPSALIQTLEPLTKESNPWRFSALEMKAFLLILSHQKGQGVEILKSLLNNAEAPDGVRQRSLALVAEQGEQP